MAKLGQGARPAAPGRRRRRLVARTVRPYGRAAHRSPNLAPPPQKRHRQAPSIASLAPPPRQAAGHADRASRRTRDHRKKLKRARPLSPPPGGGRSIGGLRPPSFYVKNADAERRLCEARRVGVRARVARCDSLHRRAPHPAHLRCATLPLQGRVKTRSRSRDAFRPSLEIRLVNDRTFSLFASFYSLFLIFVLAARNLFPQKKKGGGTPANAGHQPPHLAMRRAPHDGALI